MKLIKKHIKLIVLIIVCLLIYLIYYGIGNKNITYITLGDGYSIGINPYGSKNYGYNDYLKNYLEENNRLYKYYGDYSYNDAMIKDIYKDILLNESEEKENIKRALRSSNLLTLSVGLNDLIYKLSINEKYSEDEIINNIVMDLDKLIDEIKKYYKSKIYLIGYYNCSNLPVKKLNLKYKEYSKDNNIVFINPKNNNYCDNPNSNYPNITGYKNIYNKLLNVIDLY